MKILKTFQFNINIKGVKMNIKKEDLETLKDIELYLYNRNLNKMVVFENNFAIRKKDIGDLQAYNLYIKFI